MEFFKHLTKAHRGPSIIKLWDEFDHMGPCCYWTLVEMCAEKLEKVSGLAVTDADCLFSFHERTLRQTLRISPKNLRRLLDFCQTDDLLTYKCVKNIFEISMPKLLEVLDGDQKRARAKREQAAQAARLDIDKDIDKDKEEDKELDKDNIVPYDTYLEIEKIYTEVFPLKKGKTKGMKTFITQIKTPEDIASLRKAAQTYRADVIKNKTEPKFIKHFSTFANCWRDYLDGDAGSAVTTGAKYSNERGTDHDQEASQLFEETAS